MKYLRINMWCILVSVIVLSGCVARPYAIIDGTRSKASDLDNYDITIVSIDGKMEVGTQVKNVKPGFHYINVVTTKNLRSKVYEPRMFPVDAKECMRYVVTAQHDNNLVDDWEVKLLREEPILSCTPSEKEPEVETIPSYLAPNQTAVCIDKNSLNQNLSPVDLYPSIMQCILDGKAQQAIYNYFLASAYGMYDAQRVVDTTSHQAINIIQKHSIWSLTALEQDKFQQKLTTFIDTPESMQAACTFLQSLGKPNYVPEYMVEHGVRKLTKENPDGLANDFAEDEHWISVLRNQLKCKI
ncbi:hypothetical protein [Aliiglaciecola lipolytica]|uniref:Lipoprotein n=1 Tax=Aliiglaciecola lipolytica E3 TaxID=1127673 RepID=K6YAI4_9ALTE|nr:hypothetical protein [Aliiglaciecola lipolytica]GAC13678.1 hypothetical protein GLIP_1036 [Aliiglaciecola lipolytica E3]